eukprot:TRINITY_DN16859_c0_g1_i1.p1 TRINITY_DN16859_c0_g1~~TRINITY_DN16859_c0_g1_i1.p1  ORF type:complete len:701 (+),score=180.47 TRINITY_DN16859_c0_g1_i1:69-2171(+)
MLAVAALAHACLAAACVPSLAPGTVHNVTIPAGAGGRPVLVYVPIAGGPRRRPAMVTLHAFASCPARNLNLTGLVLGGGARGSAVEAGWIVAAPYGSAPGAPTGCQSPHAPCAWNAGGWSTAAAGNASDVAFLTRVAEYLAAHACAREDGVYATGFSAGAMMAQRLACEAPAVYAGVAPMGGAVVLGGDFAACAPRRQVGGWVSFCGSEDGVCRKAEYGSLGQQGSFELFGARCRAGGAVATYVSATTRCEAYGGCPGGALVERCVIAGLGHAISGRGGESEPAADIDAVGYTLRRFEDLLLPPHVPSVAPSPSPSPSNLLALRLLDGPASRALGARCLDGSPAGYYWRRGAGAAARRFMLVFVGSGWCTSPASCRARAATALGGSGTWGAAVHGYGIANASAAGNPDFYDWSVAYVASCDGAFFMGDREAPVDGLHFRGRAIADAVVADLARREGLGSADAVLVTGESSGGLAAVLSVDRIAAQLPRVPDVRAVADAAFFLDRRRNGGDAGSLAAIVELAGMAPAGCRDAAARWRCVSLPHALRAIARPVFLVQSLFDYSQLGASGEALGCTPPSTTSTSPLPACGAEGMSRFRAFGEAMAAQLADATRGAAPAHRGVWAVACIAHGLTQYGRYLDGQQLSLWDAADWEVPARSGRSVRRAVGDWYYGRHSPASPSDGDVHVDAPWPENPVCSRLGMPY